MAKSALEIPATTSVWMQVGLPNTRGGLPLPSAPSVCRVVPNGPQARGPFLLSTWDSLFPGHLWFRSFAAEQRLCPKVTCEALAPSPSLSNLQKIYPLEQGRVPDRKCGLKTGHLFVVTQSPSCTDIQEQPLQKRGKGRRPRNSGRYEPFWAYILPT